MSGTSLDGLDIAYCVFIEDDLGWHFSVEQAETLPYDSAWLEKLRAVPANNALQLALLHKQYGKLLGQSTKHFMQKHELYPDFIASHGHTVFHQPENKLTFQIGCGAEIAVNSGITTVCDFRTTDVAYGGQGAPLVPVGDKLLFDSFDICLNLGGFANISFDHNDKRIALDVCPCNIALNEIAQLKNIPYDANGKMAANGKVHPELLDKLNNLPYYSLSYPKSLGREWYQGVFLTLLRKFEIAEEDKLSTLCEHIACQINASYNNKHNANMLITGGGAYNDHLISRIKAHGKFNITIPDNRIIEFKEALIFAFLGLLRLEKKINCLASVTGGSKDSVCGAVYCN